MASIVHRSARTDQRRISGAARTSLASRKADAHRAARAAVTRTLRAVVAGVVDADDAEFAPSRSHMLTGWEVI